MIEFVDDPQDGHPDVIICIGPVLVGRINANTPGDYVVAMDFNIRGGASIGLHKRFHALDAAKAEAERIVREALDA